MVARLRAGSVDQVLADSTSTQIAETRVPASVPMTPSASLHPSAYARSWRQPIPSVAASPAQSPAICPSIDRP